MNKFLFLFFAGFILFRSVALAATAPDLGVADSYAVFGKAGVTNDTGGTTHIWGNVGADLLSNITNLIAGQVDGTIVAPASGVQTAASAAYDTLDLGSQGTPVVLNLAGNNTVTPGVYNVQASTLNGTLTLDGAGVYIFRSSSSITTSGAGTMSLINGATACNVYWQIPVSMTIGANAHIEGTIIAQTGLISLGSGATLKGRALSLISQVTLLLNQITKPVCTTPTSTPTPTSNSNSTSSSTSAQNLAPATSYCPPISDQAVTPIVIESKRISLTSIYIKWGPYSGVDTFNIEYGFENNKFIFNTDFKGFSTTINDLPRNQPIWVRVAARNSCQIGTYGEPKFTGSPKLPNTGFAPRDNNVFSKVSKFLNWLF